jgi:hypothetical protein
LRRKVESTLAERQTPAHLGQLSNATEVAHQGCCIVRQDARLWLQIAHRFGHSHSLGEVQDRLAIAGMGIKVTHCSCPVGFGSKLFPKRFDITIDLVGVLFCTPVNGQSAQASQAPFQLVDRACQSLTATLI